MDTTDAAVITQIKAGNINMFEVLVHRYSAKIRSFASHKLFDKEEVDDIVQNSFIQFYKALSQFDISKPVFPYLLQITRNELNMYYRKHHTMVSLNEELLQAPEKQPSDTIENIVQGLKTDHKNALLWFAEGYSYQDIARRMGKPLNSVRTLIRRARLYIQKKYPHGNK